MAFGKQITGDNGAFVGQYHRIRTVVYDYDIGQCHITIANYAYKQYREQEKAEIAANQAKIARYQELTAKDQLTEEERAELSGMSLWQLEAFVPEPRNIGPDTKVTLGIEEDVRKGLYDRLGANVSTFEGATDI
mgnify:FL=1